jgi:hypothetical protein
MQRALEYATVTIEVLLHPEPIEPAVPDQWVGFQQKFSDWLDSQAQRPKETRRRSADLHLLIDFQDDLAKAASAAKLTPIQFNEWVAGYFADMQPDMPSYAIYRIMQRQRHMNRGTKWKHSDLIDMTNLSCAAAYADVVVAERHQTAMLNQALRTFGRAQTVSRSLSEAISVINAKLS